MAREARSNEHPQHSRHTVATKLARRRFLQRLGALAGAAAAPLWQRLPLAWGADPPTAAPAAGAAPLADAAELIRGKSPGLIVHSAAPLEIETPLELLRAHAVTPAELLFVRNNGALADSNSLDPAPLAGWSIDVSGLVEFPRTLDAARLGEMARRCLPRIACPRPKRTSPAVLRPRLPRRPPLPLQFPSPLPPNEIAVHTPRLPPRRFAGSQGQ